MLARIQDEMKVSDAFKILLKRYINSTNGKVSADTVGSLARGICFSYETLLVKDIQKGLSSAAEESKKLNGSLLPGDKEFFDLLNQKINGIIANPHVNHGNVITKLIDYCHTNSLGFETSGYSFIKEARKGLCSGFCELVSYGIFLEGVSDKIMSCDDWAWINEVCALLDTWDPDKNEINGEKRDFTEKEKQDIERLMQHLVFLHNVQTVMPSVGYGETSQLIADTRQRQFNNFFRIGGEFSKEGIQSILNALVQAEIPQAENKNEPRFFHIKINCFKPLLHEISIIKRNNEIIYYDPENVSGPIKIKDTRDLSDLLFRSYKCAVDDLPLLSLRVFGLGKRPDFPQESEIWRTKEVEHKSTSMINLEKKKDPATVYPPHMITLLKRSESETALNTPLHIAALSGSIASVQYYLQRGVNVNALNKQVSQSFQSPLSVAVTNNYPDVVEMLLYAKADVTPEVFISAVLRNNLDIVKLLSARNKDIVNAKDEEDRYPILCAIANGSVEMTKLLLEANAQINTLYPIKLAILAGHVDILRELLIHQNMSQENANKIFEYAFDLLSQKKVDIRMFETIFKYAMPNINHFNQHGFTALHYACNFGDEVLVKLLLESGANYSIPSVNQNQLPLHLAARKSNTLITESLLMLDAKMATTKDTDGYTPLHYAVDNGQIETVKKLLALDIYKNATYLPDSTTNCLTPIQVAIQRGTSAILELLLNYQIPDKHSVQDIFNFALAVRNENDLDLAVFDVIIRCTQLSRDEVAELIKAAQIDDDVELNAFFADNVSPTAMSHPEPASTINDSNRLFSHSVAESKQPSQLTGQRSASAEMKIKR